MKTFPWQPPTLILAKLRTTSFESNYVGRHPIGNKDKWASSRYIFTNHKKSW